MGTILKLALQLVEAMKYRIENGKPHPGMDALYLEIMKERDRAAVGQRDTETLDTLADRALWLNTFDEINEE